MFMRVFNGVYVIAYLLSVISYCLLCSYFEKTDTELCEKLIGDGSSVSCRLFLSV